MTSNDTVIEAYELVKVYGDGHQIRALDGVSFSVQRGEMVAVMGPSGCGKSTLLHMLGALDRPTSGSVSVGGQDLRSVHDVDRFRARTVGFIFQMHNLIPTLTAFENVEIPMHGQTIRSKERRNRACELLRLVGLEGREGHFPHQLSGGQRQRVAVARALANRPELILADEPTGNLDSASGEEVMRLLRQLNEEQGTTLLLVTHDHHVARTMRRVMTMRDGRIENDYPVVDEATEDLRELARSSLGTRLPREDVAGLAGTAFVQQGTLTDDARCLAQVLRGLGP
jgi:ABC-type lipoprotein export system ATPase subunit